MAYISINTSQHGAGFKAANRLFAAAWKAVRDFREMRRRRNTIRRLEALANWQLDDIGVERTDILEAADVLAHVAPEDVISHLRQRRTSRAMRGINRRHDRGIDG